MTFCMIFHVVRLLLIDRLDRNLSLSEPRNRENHYCKPQLAVKIRILSQLLSFFIFYTFIIKAEVHLTMSNQSKFRSTIFFYFTNEFQLSGTFSAHQGGTNILKIPFQVMFILETLNIHLFKCKPVPCFLQLGLFLLIFWSLEIMMEGKGVAPLPGWAHIQRMSQ